MQNRKLIETIVAAALVLAPAWARAHCDSGIAAADAAVLAGSPDLVAKSVAAAAERGIRDRFARVAETMKHADHDVASGRAFVAAYVDFMHYTERLHADATGPVAHAAEPGSASHAAAPAHRH